MTKIYNRQDVVDRLTQRLKGRKPGIIARSLREASVLVAVTVGECEPSLILTRRAGHLDIHPGEAAFPGGKKDQEDRSLLHTALREADEEISLPAAEFEFLGQLDQRVTRSDIKVSPFVGLVPAGVQLIPNLQELDCIYTVPLTFFVNADNLVIEEKEFRGEMKKVPCFYYQQHAIWGVTALIIMDLVNTVFDAGLFVE